MAGPAPHHMGEVFTNARPTEDPVLFGSVQLDPAGHFEVRSLQSFRLTYTTGRYGLDDTGSIRIVFRFTADGGGLQTDDATAANYVTAISSTNVPLRVSFHTNHTQRPWYQALTITVHHGFLREGEQITVVLGDRSGGSPGLRLQSMAETAFDWRVLADLCATGHYVPVAESPKITITPGQPALWKAVLPTLRRPDEVFRLGLKAEDIYGNPSDKVSTRLHLKPSRPVTGLPDEVDFPLGKRSVVIEGLSASDAGPLAIEIFSDAGEHLATSNPMLIRAGRYQSCWADMHGQSGESVGINTAQEYFAFARDLAFLDATSHQANDFQVNSAFWVHINHLSAEFLDEGKFLTLPGYEWSGNTGVGGDRNVYFRHEGRVIHRSSHALIEDRREIHTDAPTARDLFSDLQDEDCVVYAHIGGRPADIAYAHDPRLETAMEIHSAWGTFEWLMADCFAAGHRVGVVANSDGHKGRPGASYPGASEFGAYGGLTCFLMDQLTRDDLFACLRIRRHYATTGNRMLIDLSVEGEFDRFDIDPKVATSQPHECTTLEMGDIARSRSSAATVSFSVKADAPILRVDVLNGMAQVKKFDNPAPLGPQNRLRVQWRGAIAKGRGAKASWQGVARFSDCTILETVEINAWNPDKRLRQDGDALHWDAVTAGNFGAFDVWLDEGNAASIAIETNHGSAAFQLADIGGNAKTVPLGGLDLEVSVERLPDTLDLACLTGSVTLPLTAEQDNPIWIRVTTEDGFQGWTSPVYLIA